MLPIASNSNRTNSQDGSPRSQTAKSSMTFRIVLAASGRLVFDVPGSSFYVSAGNGPAKIRPIGEFPGVENLFYPGTGIDLALENSFSKLEFTNPSSTTPLVLEMFAGFDRFIDKRLMFPNGLYSQIPICALSVADGDVSTNLLVEDKSGEVITDNNGTQWYAVSRQLLLVFSADSSDTIFVVNLAANKTYGYCKPALAIQLAISGDVRVNMGGSAINGVVTEVYNCLPKL